MLTSRSLVLASLVAIAALPSACADDTSPAGEATKAYALPQLGEAKADNYISTNAREFALTGEASLTLPDSFATMEGDARAVELMRLAEAKLPAISRAVRTHVDATLEPFNEGASGEERRWFTYFKRDHATAIPPTVVDEKTATFGFQMQLVGSPFLMSKLAPDTTGRRTFEIEVKDHWSDTSGAKITVEVVGSASRDAFPRYNELFADGVFDITVQFGGDYNKERFDLETARWLVDHLLEDASWAHPSVKSFDDLAIDSGPFVRRLVVEGQPLEARVTVIHSDMVEEADEAKLTEAMKDAFGKADIVVYSGHAGEGAGFILDYQPRHEIKASELAALPLADKYQVYVFDGCRTYRTYVDDLMKNPAKSFQNVDIVTTINTTPFSVGYQVLWELIYWFTLTDDDGNHFPVSWQALLRGLNTDTDYSVHYGVHGIDEDPQLNPHQSAGVACSPCRSDTDCGAGGNLCLGYGGGAACGVACTTNEACGEGYRCAKLVEDDDLFYLPKQCLRVDQTCP